MIQIRLREADVRILVEALRSYLADRRRAEADAGARDLNRGLRVKLRVLESIIKKLAGSASGSGKSAPREGGRWSSPNARPDQGG